MNTAIVRQFHETVWSYYAASGRHELPWRRPEEDGSFDPYKIMVSELMLQQTQVNRVVAKYEAFIETFPTISSLANAELGSVLRLWQGLGYNRRAKFLWQAAQQIDRQFNSRLPRKETELVALPGIGPNTAGAIVAYAFDKPTVFIETNIRTIMVSHFFDSTELVADKEIRQVVSDTLPPNESIRQWYWALMDYGAYLKRTKGSLNHRTSSYRKQAAFQGSRRQIRGAVLRYLHDGERNLEELRAEIRDDRLTGVVEDLVREGLVRRQKDKYRL